MGSFEFVLSNHEGHLVSSHISLGWELCSIEASETVTIKGH